MLATLKSSILVLFFAYCSLYTANAQTCSQLSIGLGISNTNPCLYASTSFWRLGDWQLQNNVKWFVNNVQVGTGSNLNYTFNTTGSHVVKIEGSTSDNSCTKSNTLTVNVASNVGAVSGLTTVNAGQQGVVYSVPSMGSGTYNWHTTTDAQIVSGQGTNSITVNFGNGIGSSFQIVAQYTSAGGCTSSSSLTVQKGTVIDCNSLSLGIGVSTQPPCLGQNTSFWMTGSSTLQSDLTWYVNNVQVGTGQNLNYTFATAGTYSIKLVGKTAGNTCIKENTTSVTVLPTVGPISGATTVSPNSNQTYTVPNMGAGTYNWWYTTDAQIISGQNTSSATYHFGNSITNSFIVNVGYTSANGCYTERSLTITKGINCVDSVVKAYVTRNQVRLRAKQKFNPNCRTRTEDLIGDTVYFQLPSKLTLSRPVAIGDKAFLVVQKGNKLDTIRYQTATPQGNDLPYAGSTQGIQPNSKVVTRSLSFWVESAIGNGGIELYLLLSLSSPLANARYEFPPLHEFIPCDTDTLSIDVSNDVTPDLGLDSRLVLGLDKNMDYVGFQSNDFDLVSLQPKPTFAPRRPMQRDVPFKLSYFVRANCRAYTSVPTNYSPVDTFDLRFLENGALAHQNARLTNNLTLVHLKTNNTAAPITVVTGVPFNYNLSYVNNSTTKNYTGWTRLTLSPVPKWLTINPDSVRVFGGNMRSIIDSIQFARVGNTITVYAKVVELVAGDLLRFRFLMRADTCLNNFPLVLNDQLDYGCERTALCQRITSPNRPIIFKTFSARLRHLVKESHYSGSGTLTCNMASTARHWVSAYRNDSSGVAYNLSFNVNNRYDVMSNTYVLNNGNFRTFVRGRGANSAKITFSPTRGNRFVLPQPSCARQTDSVFSNRVIMVDKLLPGDTLFIEFDVFFCCPNKESERRGVVHNFLNHVSSNIVVDNINIDGSYLPTVCAQTGGSVNADNPVNTLSLQGLGIECGSTFLATDDTLSVDFQLTKLTNFLSKDNLRNANLVLFVRTEPGLGANPNAIPTIYSGNGQVWRPRLIVEDSTYNVNVNVRHPKMVQNQRVVSVLRVEYSLSTLVDMLYSTNPNATSPTLQERLDAFFTGAIMNFSLRTYCPQLATFTGKTRYAAQFFFRPEGVCGSPCLIPLLSAGCNKIVNCPGCKIPGTVITRFNIQRSNLGFADEDNNRLPDQIPPQTLSRQSPIFKNIGSSLKRVMPGDTLLVIGASSMNDDDVSAKSINDSLFSIRYLYMRSRLPRGQALQPITQQVTIRRNDVIVAQNVTLPINSITWQDTPANDTSRSRTFLMDLSLDVLKTATNALNDLHAFDESISLEWQTRYVVTKNYPGLKRIQWETTLFYTGEKKDVLKANTISFLNADVVSGIKAADSTAGLKCEFINDEFSLVGFQFTMSESGYHQTSQSNRNCEIYEDITFRSFVPGYEGQDLFPFEFRPAPVPDSLVLHHPTALNYANIVIGDVESITGAENLRFFGNATTRTAGNTTVFLSRLFAYKRNFDGIIPKVIRDQGEYLRIQPHFRPACGDTTAVYTMSQTGTRLHFSGFYDNTLQNNTGTYYFINKKAKLLADAGDLNPTININVNEANFAVTNLQNGLRLRSMLSFYNPANPEWVGAEASRPFVALRNKDRSVRLVSAQIDKNSGTIAQAQPNGIAQLYQTNTNGDTQSWVLAPNVRIQNKLQPRNYMLDIRGQYTNCQRGKTQDTLWLLYGWSCDVMNTLADCHGQLDSLPIYVNLGEARYEMSQNRNTDTLSLCERLQDTVRVRNNGDRRFESLEAELKFSNGSLPLESAQWVYRVGNAEQRRTLNVNQGNTYKFTTIGSDALGQNGLGATENLLLVYTLRNGCPSTSQEQLDIQFKGRPFCGDSIVQKLIKRLVLDTLGKDLLQITIKPDTISNCSTRKKTIFVTVKNLKNTPTQRANTLYLLPSNGLVLAGRTSVNIPVAGLGALAQRIDTFTVQPTSAIPTAGTSYILTAKVIGSLSACNSTCTRRDTTSATGTLFAEPCPEPCTPNICALNQGIVYVSNTSMPTILGSRCDSITTFTGGGTFDGTYLLAGNVLLQNGTYTVQPGTKFYADGQFDPAFVSKGVASYGDMLNPTIALQNATLDATQASFQAVCDTLWGGILMLGNGNLSMNQVDFSDAYYVMRTNLPNAQPPNTTVTITNSTFRNNPYGLFQSGVVPSGSLSVNNSSFDYIPATAKKPVLSSANLHIVYEDSNISITNSTFKNTQFDAVHVSSYNGSVQVDDNTFENVAFGIHAFGKVASSVTGNSVDVSYFGSGIGVNIISNPNHAFTYGTQSVVNNRVFSSTGVPAVGIYRGPGELGRYLIQDNTVENAIYGVYEQEYTLDNNYPDVSYTNNNLRNCQSGLLFNDNSATLNSLTIECNTFDNSGGTINSQGIVVGDGVVLDPIGGGNTPPGNKFLGFDGQNGRFAIDNRNADLFIPVLYFKHPDETGLFISGIVQLPLSIKPSCSAKGYANGNFRMAAIEEDQIDWEKDSLRYRVGTASQLRRYERDIITYHSGSNDLVGLSNYAQSLINCNRGAYYRMCFYLFETYGSQGDTAKVSESKQALLLPNPNHSYVKAYISLFEYKQRNPNRSFMPFQKLSEQDSVLLAELTTSNTPFAMEACQTLNRVYGGYPCQYQSTASESLDLASPNCNKTQQRKGDEDANNSATFGNQVWLGLAYPNPSHSEVTINYNVPNKETVASIKVMESSTGKIVKEVPIEAGTSYVQVNLADLKPGVYAYTLLLNGIPTKTKSLIVIR